MHKDIYPYCRAKVGMLGEWMAPFLTLLTFSLTSLPCVYDKPGENPGSTGSLPSVSQFLAFESSVCSGAFSHLHWNSPPGLPLAGLPWAILWPGRLPLQLLGQNPGTTLAALLPSTPTANSSRNPARSSFKTCPEAACSLLPCGFHPSSSFHPAAQGFLR